MLKKFSLLIALYTTTNLCHAADSYEQFNRDVESFNASLDAHVVKPTTEAYITIAPDPFRQATNNFVNNLSEPLTIINDLLQGKIEQSVQDTARFIFNSTFGLFGLIDISTPMGLSRHDEDFGQTFASWGWDQSDYLNLPLLGPATVRDATGKPLNLMMTNFGIPLTVARLLTVREKLIPLDTLIDTAPDRYLFVRDAYMQQRQFAINDGKTNNKQQFKEFDFSD